MLSLTQLAALCARIGNLTFGGGDPAMLALQREVVERRRWMSTEDFTVIWSLARVTPGTNVIACFAGVGWRLAGSRGALVAAIASCLPAGVLCFWLALAERRWQGNTWLVAALQGISAAVVGMMLAGAWNLLKPAVRRGARSAFAAIPVALAAAAASHAGAPPIAILAAAALTGWFLLPAGEQEASS